MNTTPFTHALTSDMARLDLNERQLGHRLGVTQQAIGKWLKQGFPPRRRVAELVEIFGSHSAVAALTPVQMYQEPSEKRSETPGVGTPQHPVQDLKASAVRKLQTQGMREFELALPAGLHGRTEAEIALRTAAGTRKLPLEYASERLFLAVVARAQGGPLATVAPAVLRLLAAARMATGAKPRTVLAVLTDMPSDDATRGESVAMAQALGIELWVCHSGHDLAARVSEAEGVELETQEEDTE